MKLKSLILGSIAAAGLSTAGYAADLGVLTSLDVCNTLGLSGLTISSDTNCLQISGGVSYEFNWGDYRRSANFDALPLNPWADADDGTNDFPVNGSAINGINGAEEWIDYESKVEAWLRLVGTASSDFGSAKAVIGFHQVNRNRTINAGWTQSDDAPALGGGYFGQGLNNDSTNGLELSEAYVSIGDSTIIMAGLRKDGKDGSVGNFDDDTPFNYLGTFGSSITSNGLLFKDGAPIFGGASIQVVTDLGNGVNVGVGLENIDNTDGNTKSEKGISNDLTANMMPSEYAGTLLGVVNYAGENLTAHVTAGAIGVLDGNVDSWFAHAGATGTFDAFKLRAAFAYLRDDTYGADADFFQGLVSGQATFDMFTIALSGEYKSSNVAGIGVDGFGFGGSVGAALTDTISLNLGGRYFNTSPDGLADFDQWQIEAQLVAALTETIKVTGAVGVYGGDVVTASLDPAGAGAGMPNLSGRDSAFYGSLGLDWNPGGGFLTSVKGMATSEGAYKATFKASKSFE
ncbi:MAG TPA: hypothetical protein VL147_21315 [Devosia sp.]|nr:hypothetical protein [Devosia sp.]